LRRHEDAGDGFVPVGEDAPQLAFHERHGNGAESSKRQAKTDFIVDQRSAIRGRCKPMAMNPFSVRPMDLHVDELERRFPHRDQGAPAKAQAVEPDVIVNEPTGPHVDRGGREDFEPHLGRGDALEVRRIRKEGEYGVTRTGKRLART